MNSGWLGGKSRLALAFAFFRLRIWAGERDLGLDLVGHLLPYLGP